MKRMLVATACLFVALMISSSYSAVLIDSFTTAQGPVTRTAPGDIGIPIGSSAAGGGKIGGERDIRVDLIAGPNGNRISVVVASFNHSQDGGITGTSLTSWDGPDGNALALDPTGLGGADLTAVNTQNALDVRIISADLNSSLKFEVFTDGSNSSVYTLALPGGALNESHVIPFANFLANLGAGADFSNVGAITMLVDGSLVPSLDIVVELLQTASLIMISKTDALVNDVDFDGNVDVGDTIKYTITITNPDDDGDAAAAGVVFNDTPDPNTDLVVGSVMTSQGVVTTGNTLGDTSVSVNVGSVADGASVTIMFEVTVAVETPEVCNQGFVDGTPPSDDPGTPAPDDPTCTPVTFCGDGIVNDVTEQCDDGDNIDNDECTNNCTLPRCGDGIVQPSNNEECDDGNNIDGDGCQGDCQNPECGDGILDAGEECDDGNTIDGDGCQGDCQNPECGDGILDAGEECDDGNTIDGDGCQGDCQNPECGDGILDPGEECDDGNTIDGDGCQGDCQNPECGDGILDPGEQCDDGNNVGGDGCSATCRSEICGNNVLDPGEECDGTANQNCESGVCLSNCTCETDGEIIPTVSEWGLVILSLLLLCGAKVYFGRRDGMTIA